MGCHHQIPLLRAQGTLKKSGKEYKSVRGDGEQQGIKTFQTHRTGTHMNSQRPWRHTQGLQGSAQKEMQLVLELKEVDIPPPVLTKKLFPMNNHLQMEICFSPSDSHWGNKQLLRVSPVSSNRCPTENKLKPETQQHLWSFGFVFSLQICCIYIMTSDLGLYRIPVCVNICVSVFLVLLCHHLSTCF